MEQFVDLPKTYFIIKSPDKYRKSFSILKETRTSSKRNYVLVKSEALSAINHSIKKHGRNPEEFMIRVRQIVDQLYSDLEKRSAHREIQNSDNLQILTDFWNEEYESRDLVDVGSAKNDFLRAIRASGKLSLYSATKEQLQKQIADTSKGNCQRRVVSRLNTLLKYIKRDIRLRKNKASQAVVKHLTEDEFLSVLQYVEDPKIILLCRVAFYSGARAGEIFSLSRQSIRGDHLFLFNQLDRQMNLRDMKNRQSRIAWCFKQGRADIKDWILFHDKQSYRNIKLPVILKEACKKAFPNDNHKWCVFHDLRHSYAINLLSKGVSLGLVAQSLGNSVVVCQKHYTGFILSDESVRRIDSMMS